MVAALDWQLQLSGSEVWQRQALVVQVQTVSAEPFARLHAGELKIPGVEVQPLAFERQAEGELTRLSLGWVLYPHTPGELLLSLPPVTYSGGPKQPKWQAPLQRIKVNPLPPYLPPTTPVGAIRIESRIEPEGILQPGHLAYWHLSLRSDAVASEAFPPLLRQLQGHAGLEVLPARLQRGDNITADKRESRLDYRIPLKPLGSGRLQLPELQWHWFDPASGRLQHSFHEAQPRWVLARWQQLGLALGLLLATLAAAVFALRFGHLRLSRYRSRRRLQAALGATDIAAVTTAMRYCAQQHGWPQNLSTQQWLQHWQRRYGESASLHCALDAFEARRFGPAADAAQRDGTYNPAMNSGAEKTK